MMQGDRFGACEVAACKRRREAIAVGPLVYKPVEPGPNGQKSTG